MTEQGNRIIDLSPRSLLKRMWVGGVLCIASLIAGTLIARLFGEHLGSSDWRVVTLVVLLVSAITLAAIEELGRPQNPYRNLDPRFSYMDAGPQGQLHSTSGTLLWQLLPPATFALLLLIWLIT